MSLQSIVKSRAASDFQCIAIESEDKGLVRFGDLRRTKQGETAIVISPNREREIGDPVFIVTI
jgi:hypothetical protein